MLTDSHIQMYQLRVIYTSVSGHTLQKKLRMTDKTHILLLKEGVSCTRTSI